MPERNAAPRGPRFHREGDQILFVYEVDTATTIGPIAATEAHKANFPRAWREFELVDGVTPPNELPQPSELPAGPAADPTLSRARRKR